MLRLTERDKECFEEEKIKKAKEFSAFVSQLMGLDMTEDGHLYHDEALLNYDGFIYFPYTDEYEKVVATDEETFKIFNPYENLKLMEYCFRWFLDYEIGISEERVLVLALSNNKMNSIGHCMIKFYKKEPGINYDENTNIDTDGTVVEGHDYYRDCLKYADMMMMFSGALPFEYDELRKMELSQFETFVISSRNERKKAYAKKKAEEKKLLRQKQKELEQLEDKSNGNINE